MVVTSSSSATAATPVAVATTTTTTTTTTSPAPAPATYLAATATAVAPAATVPVPAPATSSAAAATPVPAKNMQYEVEDIYDERVIKMQCECGCKGFLKYEVKWKHHGNEENSWEPENHLQFADSHGVLQDLPILQKWKLDKQKVNKAAAKAAARKFFFRR